MAFLRYRINATPTLPTQNEVLTQGLTSLQIDANFKSLDSAKVERVGEETITGSLTVDNIKLDGNTISSADTNGNITIFPNGTGDVYLDADTIRIGESSAAVTLTTNTTTPLTITTGAVAATAVGNSITIQAGTGGATSGNGGALDIKGGAAQTSGVGGALTLESGVSVGSNITGSTTTIKAGNGTGTGGSGSIDFQVAASGSTGTTANTFATRLSIANTGVISASGSVTSTSTTTGTVVVTGGVGVSENLWVGGYANIDNLRLQDNTLSSTDTNGNVVLAPNGTGDVQLDADTVRIGDANTAATLTTNGTGNLTIRTGSANSGTVLINQGDNGDIDIEPHNTGNVNLITDTVRLGSSNENSTITTNGNADLILNTNAGTNSGKITIFDGADGDIEIEPEDAGNVNLIADTVRLGSANEDSTITTNGTADLILNTNAGTNSGKITIFDAANQDIEIEPNGTGNVNLIADTVRLGSANEDSTVTTNGLADLIFNTNGGTNSGVITIFDGANNNIEIQPNGTGTLVVNESGVATDVRIEGDTDANLFFVDGSADRVGVGTNTPTAKFNVEGAVIINDLGADVDVRIEGDTDANLFFTDASTDRVGVGTSAPQNKVHIQQSSATTNAVTQVLRLDSQSAGAPANGIGVGLEFAVETAANNTEIGATIEAVVTDVTATSEDFDLVFRTMIAGAAAAQVGKLNNSSLQIGANATATTLTTQGNSNLTIRTGSTNSGTILINQGDNGDVDIEPNGTGNVNLIADTVRLGSTNEDSTVTTNGTADLILNTNAGTNSGVITIFDGANQNIQLAPNGTGVVNITKNLDVDGDVNIDGGDLTVSTTTFNLANTTATTLNLGGAALALNAATTTTATISNVARASNVVTITTSAAHNLTAGDVVKVQATNNTNVNSNAVVVATVPTGTTFTYSLVGSDIAASGDNGTVTRGRLYVNSFLDVKEGLLVRGGDIVTNQTTFNLLQRTATTVNAFGDATAINLAANATASTLTFGSAITGNTLKIAGTAAGTTNLTSDVTTGSFNLLASVTTGNINVGSASAGAVKILFTTETTSNSTGALQVAGGVMVAKDLFVGGADIISDQATFNIIDAAANTTVNAFGGATTLNLGHDGTSASTTNVATGATASGSTKTINIGTAGASGSTTNVNVGSAIATNTGTLTVNTNDIQFNGSGNIQLINSGTTKRGILGVSGSNDQWFVGGGATATDGGFLEISTGDNGTEPIYVRQYNGASPIGAGVLTNEATLLDANGNTAFPKSVSANTFAVPGLLMGTANVTTTSTTQAALHTVAFADYDGGRYTIQAKRGTLRQISEIIVTHDGSTAIATEYAILMTGARLFNVDVDINSTNMRVLVTSTDAASTAYRAHFNLLKTS